MYIYFANFKIMATTNHLLKLHFLYYILTFAIYIDALKNLNDLQTCASLYFAACFFLIFFYYISTKKSDSLWLQC
jgi:hypothetical protein